MEKAVINGKETELKFDFGAVRLFNRLSGKDFMKLKEKDFAETDNIAYLLLTVAQRGNQEITMDDIDALSFAEVTELSQKLTKLVQEYFPAPQEGQGKSDGPLKEKRQK